ncbi:MAG: hypothetical protein ACK4OM_07200 [Alphaproteobacteria bacterium]
MVTKFSHLLISASVIIFFTSSISSALEADNLPSIELHFENLPQLEIQYQENHNKHVKEITHKKQLKQIHSPDNKPKFTRITPAQTIKPEQNLPKPQVEITKIPQLEKEKSVNKELPVPIKNLDSSPINLKEKVEIQPEAPSVSKVVSMQEQKTDDKNKSKVTAPLPDGPKTIISPSLSEPSSSNNTKQNEPKLLPPQELQVPDLPQDNVTEKKLEEAPPVKELNLPPLILPNNTDVKAEKPETPDLLNNEKEANILQPPLPVITDPQKSSSNQKDILLSLNFSENDNNISAQDKIGLDSIIKKIKSDSGKVKIVAYSSEINNSPNDTNIINLQRLINVKKYFVSNGINDLSVSTSMDTKSNAQKNKGQLDIIKDY